MSEGRPEDLRRIGDRAADIDGGSADRVRLRLAWACVVALIVALPVVPLWTWFERSRAEAALREHELALERTPLPEKVRATRSSWDAEKLLGPCDRIDSLGGEMEDWETEGDEKWPDSRWMIWVDAEDGGRWFAAIYSRGGFIRRWEMKGH